MDGEERPLARGTPLVRLEAPESTSPPARQGTHAVGLAPKQVTARVSWGSRRERATTQKGLRHYLEQVVTRRADAGDANVHFVELEPQDDNGPIGCDYHPHVTTHESMAAIMEAELARIAGN